MAGEDRIRALRAQLTPGGAGEGLAQAVRERALALGVRGWVRGDAAPGEPLGIHAEGPPAALDALREALAADGRVGTEAARVEGHEQFAIRGVSAGVFVIQEHQARAHHYDLRLEVGGVMRSWAVPKGPSLDPAVKRLAVQVGDHALSHNTFEAPTDGGGVIIWDRGTYEQGGRVPWPEALDRGHAVFVLHGEKLTGGFALQRTGRADPPQWLLVKRRDAFARPGFDVVAARPESVASGRTLAELIAGG
jgi:DNA ligase D-like protein (predicted 3'-phosphoesterase)